MLPPCQASVELAKLPESSENPMAPTANGLKRLVPSSLLAGLAVACSIHAGEAQAALSCTFSGFVGCEGQTEGNLKFSNFQVISGGTNIDDGSDAITINALSNNRVQLFASFTNGAGPLGGSGSFRFQADTVGSFILNTFRADSTRTGPDATVTDTVTNLSTSPVDASSLTSAISYNSGAKTTLVTIAWSTSGDLINSTQTTFQLTPVPSPLPLLGAASAFGVSRRLRQRIKARA
jgi:hypothetical protein